MPDNTPECPNAAVCQTCPCSVDDDVCFPGERLRAERDAALELLRGWVKWTDIGLAFEGGIYFKAKALLKETERNAEPG